MDAVLGRVPAASGRFPQGPTETGRNQIAEVEMPSGRVLRRLPAGAQGDGLAIAR